MPPAHSAMTCCLDNFSVNWCPRWSVDAGIRNRGDPDFGTKELWLLDKIQEVCADAGFANPLPEYKSQYKLAKDLGEWRWCSHAPVLVWLSP